MAEENLRPMSAREALYAIRVILAEIDSDSDVWEVGHKIHLLADNGLDQSAMTNFELSDHLADRLAEAHALLRSCKQGQVPLSDIDAVLALPPDLEAMVERRMPR